jgi:hypothetical protein
MKKALLVSALLVMMVGIVWATVTFDSSTGTGFVGKGDVQIAFGWNNQTLQRNAAGVTFTYNATDTYAATCTWITGEGTRGERTHNVDIPRHTSVNSTIGSLGRNNSSGLNGPNTGFILTGYGATVTDGTVPVVGGSCVGEPDNGQGVNGTWTAVQLVSSTGGLYVNSNGNSVLLQ